jgi:hypothetical protein
MKRISLALLAVLALTLVVSAQNEWTKSIDVTGTYKIMWPAPGKPNKITLANIMGTLIGGYTADNGEACEVTGKYTVPGKNDIDFQIKCSNFTINLLGTVSPDKTITGTYSSPQFPSGKYRMERQ